MRGIGYAVAEIVVFMVAASLIGYLLGRLAGVGRPGRKRSQERADLVTRLELSSRSLRRLEEHAAALAIALEAADDRIGELEAENEDLQVATADAAADDATAVDDLVGEIDRQRAVIDRLEGVLAEAEADEARAASRQAQITRLEVALAAADAAPDLAVAFSAASSGSGRYADTSVDFDIIP